MTEEKPSNEDERRAFAGTIRRACVDLRRTEALSQPYLYFNEDKAVKLIAERDAQAEARMDERFNETVRLHLQHVDMLQAKNRELEAERDEAAKRIYALCLPCPEDFVGKSLSELVSMAELECNAEHERAVQAEARVAELERQLKIEREAARTVGDYATKQAAAFQEERAKVRELQAERAELQFRLEKKSELLGNAARQNRELEAELAAKKADLAETHERRIHWHARAKAAEALAADSGALAAKLDEVLAAFPKCQAVQCDAHARLRLRNLLNYCQEHADYLKSPENRSLLEPVHWLPALEAVEKLRAALASAERAAPAVRCRPGKHEWRCDVCHKKLVPFEMHEAEPMPPEQPGAEHTLVGEGLDTHCTRCPWRADDQGPMQPIPPCMPPPEQPGAEPLLELFPDLDREDEIEVPDVPLPAELLASMPDDEQPGAERGAACLCRLVSGDNPACPQHGYDAPSEAERGAGDCSSNHVTIKGIPVRCNCGWPHVMTPTEAGEPEWTYMTGPCNLYRRKPFFSECVAHFYDRRTLAEVCEALNAAGAGRQ